MALQDTRKSEALTVYSYKYAYTSIQDMQNNITSVIGINIASLIRVDKFDVSDKFRLHYRVLSRVNDGTGVPVKVRLNPDPTITTETDMFANIAMYHPFVKPVEAGEEEKMVYWDGFEYKECGSGTKYATFEQVQEHIPFGEDMIYPSDTLVINIDNYSDTQESGWFQIIENGYVKILDNQEIQDLKNTWNVTSGESNIGMNVSYTTGDTDGRVLLQPYFNGETTLQNYAGTLIYKGKTINISGKVSTVEFVPDLLIYNDLNGNTGQSFDLYIDKVKVQYGEGYESILFNSKNVYLQNEQDIQLEVMGSSDPSKNFSLNLWTNNPQNEPFEGTISYKGKKLTFKGTTKGDNFFKPNPLNFISTTYYEYMNRSIAIPVDFYKNNIKQTQTDIPNPYDSFTVTGETEPLHEVAIYHLNKSVIPDSDCEFMVTGMIMSAPEFANECRYDIVHNETGARCIVNGVKNTRARITPVDIRNTSQPVEIKIIEQGFTTYIPFTYAKDNSIVINDTNFEFLMQGTVSQIVFDVIPVQGSPVEYEAREYTHLIRIINNSNVNGSFFGFIRETKEYMNGAIAAIDLSITSK